MTRPIVGIMPPYVLEALAASHDPSIARAGAESLRIQRQLRLQREARATRRPHGGREGSWSSGQAIVPDALRRTVQRHRPTSPAPDDVAGPAPDVKPAQPTPRRGVHDAEHLRTLPGVLRRSEGQPVHLDESVNEAYDGLGGTWQLLHKVFGRDSLDGQGLPLQASVHFERNYCNAFWDGQQMVFGDGDGTVFRSFTDAPDVIGHELAHGLTQYTAGFVYVGQSGALNESISDVFGVLTVQYARRQRVEQADWLVGAGLFTDRVKAAALRSLKAPGTAYDDPALGKDPQPSTMTDYVKLPHDEKHDNGGVHINSGIPNRAFYLAATQLGGFAWDKAGQIWYDTLTSGGLPMDTDFATFAAATVQAAQRRYGPDSEVTAAVIAAWEQVEVR